MEGKIVKIISNLYTVSSDNKLYECRARGKIRFDKLTPLVGDKVIFDEKDKYILEILPRKNSLDRPMISNVDSALIITSVKKPDLSLNLLDKELVVTLSNNIEPIIVFTKLDLLKKQEMKYIKSIMNYYRKIGIKVCTNNGLFRINEISQGANNSINKCMEYDFDRYLYMDFNFDNKEKAKSLSISKK